MQVKKVIGAVLMVIRLGLGLWVGLWLCLVGGIIAIVHMCTAGDITGGALAWDIIRILFCELFGFAAGIIPFALGDLLIGLDLE